MPDRSNKMTKTKLKENITKIEQLLNSDSYESGIQLLITMNDQKLNECTDVFSYGLS